MDSIYNHLRCCSCDEILENQYTCDKCHLEFLCSKCVIELPIKNGVILCFSCGNAIGDLCYKSTSSKEDAILIKSLSKENPVTSSPVCRKTDVQIKDDKSGAQHTIPRKEAELMVRKVDRLGIENGRKWWLLRILFGSYCKGYMPTIKQLKDADLNPTLLKGISQKEFYVTFLKSQMPEDKIESVSNEVRDLIVTHTAEYMEELTQESFRYQKEMRVSHFKEDLEKLLPSSVIIPFVNSSLDRFEGWRLYYNPIQEVIDNIIDIIKHAIKHGRKHIDICLLDLLAEDEGARLWTLEETQICIQSLENAGYTVIQDKEDFQQLRVLV